MTLVLCSLRTATQVQAKGKCSCRGTRMVARKCLLLASLAAAWGSLHLLPTSAEGHIMMSCKIAWQPLLAMQATESEATQTKTSEACHCWRLTSKSVHSMRPPTTLLRLVNARGRMEASTHDLMLQLTMVTAQWSQLCVISHYKGLLSLASWLFVTIASVILQGQDYAVCF